jgi:Zn-dependent protease/CBS domain-containing protein
MTARARPGSGGIFGARWTLLRVRGVPVLVGPSLLALIALFTFYLAGAFQARPEFDGSPGLAWFLAAVTTILFVACILAHEIGHTVTSLDRGIEVRSITLFLLGGVTESVGEPRYARDEVVIVGIGPLISLVLASVFGLAVRVLPDLSAAELIAGYLAWLNGAMAIFNLVPGYPLDGGRLLRAVLWLVTASRNRATRLAARVGQAFALTLLLGAVLSLTGVPQIGGPVVVITLQVLASLGLWGGLIGIFLLQSSLQAHAVARSRERLARHQARDAMADVPPTVPPGATLSQVAPLLLQHPSVLWPVGAPLVGGVSLGDLDAVPRHRWNDVRVDQVATTDAFVADDTPMDEAVDLLARSRHQMLIVVRDGEPIGLLTSGVLADTFG